MDIIIKSRVYVLGDDIDTDQIIPAHHLVYDLDDLEERKLYGKYALSSIPEKKAGLPGGYISFIKEGEYQSEYSIIIAGKNFGCGSSREHAPVALQIAGIRAVVSSSYARIFYRNSIDGGYFTPYECKIDLTKEIRTNDIVEINNNTNMLTNLTTSKVYKLEPLGEVEDIVNSGGIFEYARKRGMVN